MPDGLIWRHIDNAAEDIEEIGHYGAIAGGATKFAVKGNCRL